MNVHLKNVPSFLSWLDAQDFQYAVLWDLGAKGAPTRPHGQPGLVILVEDRAVEPIARRCRWALPRLGRSCEIYSAGAGHGADFTGHSFLPEPLGRSVLRNRVRPGGHAVAGDSDLYYVLLFHVAYHLAEESGGAAQDSAAFQAGAWHALLKPVGQRLGLAHELSLLDMHRALAARGYGIDPARLAAYLQSQFKRRFKSRFYALLIATEQPGEINLFVLRATVIRRGFRHMLLEEIAKHYTILAVQDIPWLTRATKARYMRGNKWRWGGWPVIAVVVFDAAPIWRSSEERAREHALVLNSRQFFKRELRIRIVREGGLYHKHNAMHTTDNEAEAIGHLDLFFAPEEERALYDRAKALRAALCAKGAPAPFDPTR